MSAAVRYRALLRQQFILQRADVVLLTVLAALIGPASLLAAGTFELGLESAERLLATNVLLAVLSVLHVGGTALFLVVRAFAADAAVRHTYAASLPIPRGEYALLRAATGMTLGLMPIGGYAIGILMVTAGVALPPALYAYPVALILRYTLAFLVSFALAFALQYGSGRHANRVVIVCLAVVAVAVLGIELAGLEGLFHHAGRVLFGPWSPLSVFAAEWKLFDV
jgi:hypothetical protein